MMTAAQSITFGALLRRYRIRAELTQEELAERALMSARGISDLERGLKRAPREYTVQALADALELSTEERAELAGSVVRVRKTPSVGVTPLPVQLTPFVGRQKEIRSLRDLLERPEVRLLTLTGPGGSGKTRLTLRVAEEVRDHYKEGIHYVELGAIENPALVIPTVAHALGIKETGDQPVMVGLQTRIAERRILLILDNFEQVLGAAPAVAELLAVCPRLTVVVTSRSALHLPGERHFPVPPLTMPDPRHAASLPDLAQSDAVTLFVQRAEASDPNFRLAADNAPAVAELCARLDGLPLAIELAAARTRALPLSAILSALRGVDTKSGARATGLSSLRVLKGEFVGVPLRHQALRSTIDWSYDHLDAGERELFARLAIFVGGFTLEAADAVCNASEDLPFDVLDGMASLVDKSLLRAVESAAGEPRFAMLQTIRQYAAERLEESGHAVDLRQRHGAYFLDLAEAAASGLTGPDQGEWLDRIEEEHDNLRAALARTLSPQPPLPQGARGSYRQRDLVSPSPAADRQRDLVPPSPAADRQRDLVPPSPAADRQRDLVSPSPAAGRGGRGVRVNPNDGATGLRLAKALWRFWLIRGYWIEGLRWLEETLAAAWNRLAGGTAVEPAVRAPAVVAAGHLAWRLSDYDRASALYEEGLALYRDLGDEAARAQTLDSLAIVAASQGQYERATALQEESLAISRALRDERGMARSLNNLGIVASNGGDYERATALFEESLALKRSLKDALGVAGTLANLGFVVQEQGDYTVAAGLYQESLAVFRDLNDRRGIGRSLADLATVKREQGDYAGARALVAESLATFREMTHTIGIAQCVEILAQVAAAEGQAEVAARLFGAADAARNALRTPLPPVDRATNRRYIAGARARLDDERWTSAWEEGHAMTLEEAARLA